MSLTSEDLQAIAQLIQHSTDDIKNYVDTRIEDIESKILNTCLGYTDDQDESIIKKIDNIQSTVNAATKLKTIDNDLYKLVNERIDQIVERVEQLEKRAS